MRPAPFLLVGAAFAIALAATLAQPKAFLFVINTGFSLLNHLDGTTTNKTWNAYAGTPVEDFFQPLLENEISIQNVPVTSNQLPAAFDGAVLFRIGPNPLFPALTTAHSFEGDGMVHAFQFHPQNNSISVNSALMETPKLQKEREHNQGIYVMGLEDLLMAINTDIIELSLFQRAVKLLKFLLSIFVIGAYPLKLSSLNRDVRIGGIQ